MSKLVQVYPYLTFPSSAIIGSPSSISPLGKCNEACRADPSPSQEHKQSISVYPEGWDSAFFTSPIYSLQISIRVSEQSSSCTCSHIATPCLKKNRKVRQKNTPHCSLSYRTPAIENHHKDYGNTMCCACKPPGAHAALHPQAVRSTRLPLEHLTPLHTKPNAKLAPKSIRSLITLTGAEREMLSSYQRDSTSGEPSDGDHLSSHALPSILQHTASPVSQLLLHSGPPSRGGFSLGAAAAPACHHRQRFQAPCQRNSLFIEPPLQL